MAIGPPDRWDPKQDGKLTEKALRFKLESKVDCVRRYEFPDGFPKHAHDTDKVEAVVSGRLRIQAGKQEFFLGPGDSLFIPRGTIHSGQLRDDTPVVCLEGEKAVELQSWRVLLFALLIVLANSWATRHLGLKLSELLVANALLVTLPQLRHFLDRARDDDVQQVLRRAFQYVVATPTLVILCSAMLVTGSFVSSVTVIPTASEDTERAFKLGTVRDGGEEGTPNPCGDDRDRTAAPLKKFRGGTLRDLPMQQWGWTTAFGRLYSLHVDGYFPHSFVLPPWTGKEIKVRDLEPIPNLILRIPAGRLVEGTLELYRPCDETTLFTTKMTSSQGTLVFGAGSAIPKALADDWKIELKDLKPDDPDRERKSFNAWMNPVTKPSSELWPNLEIEARFRSDTNPNFVTAEKTIHVSSARFQDYRLDAK